MKKEDEKPPDVSRKNEKLSRFLQQISEDKGLSDLLHFFNNMTNVVKEARKGKENDKNTTLGLRKKAEFFDACKARGLVCPHFTLDDLCG